MLRPLRPLRPLVALAAVVTSLVLAACGGSSLSAREAIEEGIRQECEKAHACRDSWPGGFPFETLYGNSPAECITNFTGFLDPGAVQQSVDEGRVRYNAGDMRVCLDFIEGLSCEEMWSSERQDPAACDTAFQGTVQENGDCTHFFDCAGELWCDQEENVCVPG
jgi:hypothetical protein